LIEELKTRLDGKKFGSGIKGIQHREFLNFLDSKSTRKNMSKKQLGAAKETFERIVGAKLETIVSGKKEKGKE